MKFTFNCPQCGQENTVTVNDIDILIAKNVLTISYNFTRLSIISLGKCKRCGFDIRMNADLAKQLIQEVEKSEDEWERRAMMSYYQADENELIILRIDKERALFYAADSYYPRSISAREAEQHFQPGKIAMRKLAEVGTDNDIRDIAFYSMTCIRDGYHYSGMLEVAVESIRASQRPLARLYSYIWDDKIYEACKLVRLRPDLLQYVSELADYIDNLDIWESPSSLIHASGVAWQVRNAMHG